jgi:hypothetical protein
VQQRRGHHRRVEDHALRPHVQQPLPGAHHRL